MANVKVSKSNFALHVATRPDDKMKGVMVAVKSEAFGRRKKHVFAKPVFQTMPSFD